MRKLLIILSILSSLLVIGQQEAQYSNYQMNNFMLNPAVAGSYAFGNAKIGYRTQWVGMEGAPQTAFATIHAPIHHPEASRHQRTHKPHHGIGASFFRDQTFAISYTGFSGSYAFHMKMDRKHTLSIGASLGLKNFQLDGNKLIFVHTPDDPEIGKNVYTKLIPDANIGFWFYSDRMFFGGSARQVLNSSLELSNVDEAKNSLSKLTKHYFITAGTLLDVSREWSFIPSFMVQSVKPAPVQVDLNGTFWYQKKAAVGFSYRNLDAVYLILDYVYNDKLEIGYAFDFTVSELSKYNGGTHEIIVGIRWGEDHHRVTCPAKFW